MWTLLGAAELTRCASQRPFFFKKVIHRVQTPPPPPPFLPPHFPWPPSKRFMWVSRGRLEVEPLPPKTPPTSTTPLPSEDTCFPGGTRRVCCCWQGGAERRAEGEEGVGGVMLEEQTHPPPPPFVHKATMRTCKCVPMTVFREIKATFLTF